MDREHLTHLVENPAQVLREDITDLKAMAERYPWFSGAHLLLAVGEHAAGDVLFDEQLRVTAAHLPSRAVLFDHVGRSEEEATRTEIRVERATPSVTGPVPTPAVHEEVLMKVVRAAEARVEKRVVLEEAPLPIEEQEPLPSEPPVEVAAAGEEQLDQQFRQAAFANSFELTWDNDLPEPEPALRSGVRAVPHTPPEAPASIAPVNVVPTPGATPPVEPVVTGSRRFTQWLELAAEPAPALLPEGTRLDQMSQAPDAADWQRGTAAPVVSGARSVPSAELPTKQLVETFLQHLPEPGGKAEFFDPQRAAKRSLQDHADLVTETLARIYEKQGNIAKAIAAYERLAVKHPERSAYFRGLAQALLGR